MVDAMHKQLTPEKTHLTHVLTKVTKDSDQKYHLFFKTNDGEREVTARAVIMTIPFSVLRTLQLDESLALPALTQEAIKTLFYGTNSKIQVANATPYHLRYLVEAESQTTSWCPPNVKGLTLVTGGNEGASLTLETAQNLTNVILNKIDSESRGTSSNAPHVMVKNWTLDEYARGSYSTMGLHPFSFDLESQKPEFKGLREFAEPVGGFIFAGEHTRVENGFMESAVQSGRIAAEYYLKNFLHESASIL